MNGFSKSHGDVRIRPLGEERRHAFWRRAVAVVVVLGVLAGGVYVLQRVVAGSPEGSEAGGAAPHSADGQAAGPGFGPAEPSTDPVASAVAWLTAYRSMRWDDAAPTAWIDRTRPVVTPRLAEESERYRDGAVGAEWPDFVQHRCTATVEGAGGVIPPEAPRTTSSAYVQVAGTLRTRCEDDGVAEVPVEDLAATVLVVRGGDGRWRVDRKLY